jgi:O-antigen/teichoic acid export membrane protein
MRALAFLSIPLFMQSAMSDALAAANHHRARSMAQIFVAGLAVLLNFVLIQRYSWKGAVISAYACQCILALCMATIVHQKTR